MIVPSKTSRGFRVLIVDGSAVARQTLKEILTSDPRIGAATSAADPVAAAERIREDTPDVMMLDAELPRWEDMPLLRKAMDRHAVPIVLCASLVGGGSDIARKARECGAREVIAKPKTGVGRALEESRIRICNAVATAAMSRPGKGPASARWAAPELTAGVLLGQSSSPALLQTTGKVIMVGASTGGTEALRFFLAGMPPDAPGMVIVQHMPERFTKSFAARLDQLCRISVKEAEDNDTVTRGRALIAPGDRHVLLRRSGTRYYVEVKDGPPVNSHRPSVDVLFRSAARCAGKNAVGVIMTGMGDDGARGLLEMKETGASTLAQDKNSCAVFGMPKEAIRLNAAGRVLPLDALASAVLGEALRQ